MKRRPEIGSHVTLVEQPDGYLSQDFKVSVNQDYEVIGHEGSCLIIRDDEGLGARIYHGRFVEAVVN